MRPALHTRSIAREIRSILSVSFVEVILAIILLCALAGSVTLGVFNRQGALDQSVDQASSRIMIDERYRAMFDFINTNQSVGNVVVFLLWAIVGLIVCNVVFFLLSSQKKLYELWRIATKGGPQARALIKQSGVRLAVRTLGLSGLIIASIVFAKYVLPSILVSLDVTLMQNLADYAPAIGSAWFMISFFFHIMVVMLRSLLLRRRLINS